MKSREAALHIIVFLSILWSTKHTRAAQCYEGTKSFEKVEVQRPYCKFTIKYSNRDCEKRPWISLEAADDWSNLVIRKPVCYYRRYEVTCFCYGHLCNEGNNIKEILARELIDATTQQLVRIITCYLLKHATGVKTATEEKDDDSENAFVRRPMKKNKIMQEGQEKGGTKLTMYIVVGGAAVLVIVTLLSLLLALLVVLKSRKKSRAAEEDEDSESNAASHRTPNDYDRLGAAKEGGGGHRVTFSTPPEKLVRDRSKSSTWEANSVRRGEYSTSERFDEGQSTSEDDSR
ncbi:unnamed protein product [Cylicocyclus nassatus]|uniref:Uncharacterized protein n=1 Tax=Cylicocyclus nassatus TaxID=53992 RepID=A0AA36DNY4_CYLNA|nr:unnamed protein product [Cylicocyclus nassatus]